MEAAAKLLNNGETSAEIERISKQILAKYARKHKRTLNTRAFSLIFPNCVV